MTPAIRLLEQQRIPFDTLRFTHAEGAHSFGDEAAQALDYPAAQIFKTLMVTLDQRKLVVAIVPVAGTLDLKALARAAGARKAAMAALRAPAALASALRSSVPATGTIATTSFL